MNEIAAGGDSLALPLLVSSNVKDFRPIVQRELFPLRTLIEAEDQQLGSDAWGRVFGVDNRWYIVKGSKGGAHVRASEWVGTNLAESVEILCPTPQIVQMRDDQLFYGSTVIEGVSDKLETANILASSTINRSPSSVVGLGTALSRIYTFDMFINNIDRHQFNFLSRNDNGTHRIYAIDFGRSLCWAGALDEFPALGSHTRAFGGRIRACHGFDVGAALSLVDRIMRVDHSLVKGICERMLHSWDSDRAIESLLEWWHSVKFFRKIERLREGLGNGSLL